MSPETSDLKAAFFFAEGSFDKSQIAYFGRPQSLLNMEQGIRWEQRFSNFLKALHKLSQAVEYIEQKLTGSDESDDDSNLSHVLDEIIK